GPPGPLFCAWSNLMKAIDLLPLKAKLGIESMRDFLDLIGIAPSTFYRAMKNGEDLSKPVGFAAAAINAGMPTYVPAWPLERDDMLAYNLGVLSWMNLNRLHPRITRFYLLGEGDIAADRGVITKRSLALPAVDRD